MTQATIAKTRTYTLQFWLLCLSSYLFFASFNMIIPELPDYLTALGGEEYKGLIISLFTLTAMISRPFSGKLTDKVGRIPVMIIGAAVCFILGFAYPLVTTVAAFFLLRLVHGFSTGFKPTGTVAYVADIVPYHRRGEALGIAGVFGTMGMASGPAIGSQIKLWFSMDVMFYTSSALAILSILVLIGMEETLKKPEKFRLSHLRINKNEVFDPSVLAPCVVMALTVFSFGIVLTIVPDLSTHLGIRNKGVYFTVFTVASLAVRIFAGKASDKHGRERVLMIATLLYAAGMLVTGAAYNVTTLLIGAVLFGLGTGMNSPTIFAWTADLSEERNRGKAMATVFIALELGIMLGALISGWVYGNEADNFPITFWTGAFFALIAFTFLLVKLVKKPTQKT
ncbi:major facilitator superfamily MFS_1 [Fulvivirga imtechensis AK7]|uniref:Major facilitator superfamily MFS_1 n=1 Tax=Fulvivirga imtechensis AK7 TaxID=1237149 RepID=L8JJW8_9BACT|nr:MFS transporter [Fulvivirga imtechensis]ELR69105.1 major facilitator superfamily MFS_1 [Fulvivirga imtechensis AK7]